MKLVKFTPEGHAIAVNPPRINFVETARERSDFACVRFSGSRDGASIYLDALVEDVLAKLTDVQPT